MKKPHIVISSCIRQKPEILQLFLASLLKLDSSFAAIEYYFVDDNIEESSSELLDKFSKLTTNKVTLVRGNEKSVVTRYGRDETTHYWDSQAIWKIARYKNKIIHYAKEANVDALMLIDSDLMLQSRTIEYLWKADKDIISEIFWTKWNPHSPLLPQVWISDEYRLYEQYDGEHLTNEQILERQAKFIVMLQEPGVYEVGGLGACTLISRKALQAGVNFSKLKNVSYWGEDRHFCIRAVALSLELFVDTHVPAFHIYRDSDIPLAHDWALKHYGENIVGLKE